MTLEVDAIKMPLWQMLFGFSGRIRRRDFWLYSCLNALAGLTVNFGLTLAFFLPMINSHTMVTPAWSSYAMLAAMAPFAWVASALNIKRLHDIGRSYRWWRINLIPVLGWVWTFMECGLRDGNPGTNPYGPPPKGMGQVADVFE